MKDFSKATPRPWQFDLSDMNFYNEIGTSILTIHRRPKIVGQDDIERSGLSIETKRNAELVEVAVNNFDKMKEAIESMLVSLNTCGSGIPWNCDTNIENAYQKCKSVLESIK